MNCYAIAIAATLSLCAACGGSDSPSSVTNVPPPTTGSSTRISAFVLDDTVRATLVSPLIVTVRDSSGAPASGVAVSMSSRYIDPSAPETSSGVSFVVNSAPSIDRVITTDGTGRVQVTLRCELKTGKVRIRVSSKFGKDSLDGIVRPGNTHHFVKSLSDTVMYVGGSLPWSVTPRDRDGNITTEAVSFLARRPNVADISGGTVAGHATGRAYITVSAGAVRDSLGISIVPNGTLIAHQSPRSFPYHGWPFVSFGLDGSGYRELATALDDFRANAPRWSDALQRFVFQGTMNGSALSVLTTTPDGDMRSVYASGGYPVATADGSWIYFDLNTATAIWRVHADGTGAAAIVPGTANVFTTHPSVAADGHRVAYATIANLSGAVPQMKIVDANTGVIQSLGAGMFPTWSPVADEIAFIDADGMSVIRGDGSGRTLLVPAIDAPSPAVGAVYSFGIANYANQVAWSPDGKWLGVCVLPVRGAEVILINRATGEVLPLTFTANYAICQVTWKA